MKRWLFLLSLLLLGGSLPLGACPFCAPLEADLFSELQDSQAVVLVSHIEGQKYKVLETLKGKVTVGKVVLAGEPRGQSSAGGALLLTTAAPANLPYWSDAPRYLSAGDLKFVRKALPITRAGKAAKWDFAVGYLENGSTEVANSAYSLLAAAPLTEVQKRAKKVGHARLLGWVKNAKIPEERRALYLLMAYPGLTSNDAGWLKSALFDSKLSPVSPLVGPYVVGYVQAGGVPALAEVEKRLLKPELPATRSMQVTRALALLGQRSADGKLKAAIKAAFLREVAHPERGPFAIAPLAVWKDYKAAPAVEKLALAKDQSTWIKVASIRYFRSFSSPEAQAALARLAKADPGLVSRTTDAYKLSDLGIE